MERYERSLYEHLDQARDPNDARKRVAISPVQTIVMANEIAVGLSQLHKHNIVCADLKPGNVLMEKDGALVISDFGLAIMVDRSIMRSASSISGAIAGTARYMAPEQHDPDTFGKVSTKADLWALGCIIVEMVTGVPVWTGKQATTILMEVVMKRNSPPIPDHLPQELQATLRLCFVHDQASRGSAEDIIAALQPIVAAEERRKAAEEHAAKAAAAAAFAASSPPPVLANGSSISTAVQEMIDLLGIQACPTVGAPVDPHLQVAIEQMGLSATQQAVLLRDGVQDVAALNLLEEEDFRLLGIQRPPSTGGAAGGAATAMAPVATPQEKAELRDLLSNEGNEISEAGRATLLGLIGNLTQLCQLNLQTMQAIGLNAVDRRRLANLSTRAH
eukprot:SAG11_NODE_1214_length_5503_cov_5.844560_4_plen_389_part_00